MLLTATTGYLSPGLAWAGAITLMLRPYSGDQLNLSVAIRSEEHTIFVKRGRLKVTEGSKIINHRLRHPGGSLGRPSYARIRESVQALVSPGSCVDSPFVGSDGHREVQAQRANPARPRRMSESEFELQPTIAYSRGLSKRDPKKRLRRTIGDANDGCVVDLHFGFAIGIAFCK